MMLISEADRTRVGKAIESAERRTAGEIIAMITADSSTYAYAPMLWAALIALLLPWPFIAWTWWPVQTIYLMQLAVFVALALVLKWRPLRLALVPASVKRQRAHHRAVEQFLAQNLHTTAGRTGVLIYVSVAERYVEILADTRIDALVPKGDWQAIVDSLTRRIGAGEPAAGLVEAIEACGARLAKHFPPGSHDPNELPNHLIVLPSAAELERSLRLPQPPARR